MRIIALFGKAESGKDTTYDILRGIDPYKLCRFAFADTIKEIAKYSFGWDGKKDIRGRELLQVLGTEAGRAYNENIWLDKGIKELRLLESLKPNCNVMITDIRFQNEMERIKEEFEDVTVCKVIMEYPPEPITLRQRQRKQFEKDTGIKRNYLTAQDEVSRSNATSYNAEIIRNIQNNMLTSVNQGRIMDLDHRYGAPKVEYHASENDLNNYQDYDYLFRNQFGKLYRYKKFLEGWYDIWKEIKK